MAHIAAKPEDIHCGGGESEVLGGKRWMQMSWGLIGQSFGAGEAFAPVTLLFFVHL